MTVHDALKFFHSHRKIVRALSPLEAVGLGCVRANLMHLFVATERALVCVLCCCACCVLTREALLQTAGCPRYLTIGQPMSTLSGGEAQRVKIASELKKSGRTYVMDEPTTGLHNTDVKVLVEVLDKLVDAGNTVVVITHSLELMQMADWLIDVGPEGGECKLRIALAQHCVTL